MAEHDGERHGELAQPEVNIGSADAGHFDSHNGFASVERGDVGILAHLKGLFVGG